MSRAAHRALWAAAALAAAAPSLAHAQVGSYRYASIVVDDASGKVTEAVNADAPRYLEPLRLENYYWSRRHHSRDDLRLTDTDVAIEELTAYRDAGGGTIVDVTSVGLGRDP